MRFSTDSSRAVLVMLRHFFPIWGAIAVFISLLGLLIAQLEAEIAADTALYVGWVTSTTVGYGDLVPTTAITRVLAIVIAIMGIVLTGNIVTIAIEAAKITVENSISIQGYWQAVTEKAAQRGSRDRKRRREQYDEEGWRLRPFVMSNQ